MLAGQTACPTGKQTGLADSIVVRYINRTEAGLAVGFASKSAGQHTYWPADLLVTPTATSTSVRFTGKINSSTVYLSYCIAYEGLKVPVTRTYSVP